MGAGGKGQFLGGDTLTLYHIAQAKRDRGNLNEA